MTQNNKIETLSHTKCYQQDLHKRWFIPSIHPVWNAQRQERGRDGGVHLDFAQTGCKHWQLPRSRYLRQKFKILNSLSDSSPGGNLCKFQDSWVDPKFKEKYGLDTVAQKMHPPYYTFLHLNAPPWCWPHSDLTPSSTFSPPWFLIPLSSLESVNLIRICSFCTATRSDSVNPFSRYYNFKIS